MDGLFLVFEQQALSGAGIAILPTRVWGYALLLPGRRQ